MEYLLGTRRGLDACASRRGTFAVLALDHRQNLRRELHPDSPETTTFDEMVAFKRVVVRELADSATGILLDPEVGAAQCVADGSLPGRAGLIVALETTGHSGPRTDRRSGVLPGWSVERVKRMGGSAAKLLVYYHPDAPHAVDQEALVREVAARCRQADLPLFVEPLGYDPDSGDALHGEARRRCVVRTAQRLTPLGGDVLKAEFPYEPAFADRHAWADACAELDAASCAPWVLLSGGADDATFEAQVRVACEAGASGVLAGRSVWAPAATMPPAARHEWLASEGRCRLERLAELADTYGRPWQTRGSPPARLPAPGDGWWREYPE